MNIIIERFKKIQSNISKIDNTNGLKIIAISKTFSLEHIMPLIELGHDHFGENKVQEQKLSGIKLKKKRKSKFICWVNYKVIRQNKL